MKSLNVVSRKLSAHAPLPLDALIALNEVLGPACHYDYGQTIAEAGAACGLITFLESGMLCRSVTLASGRRQLTGVLIPGDSGDLEAVGAEYRTDSLEAVTRASVWRVPKNRLVGLARMHPSLAEALAREAALNVAISQAWIVNIGARPALQRIAHFLCELCARIDAAHIGDSRSYPFPLRQEEVANAQGISLVHVNRVLQQLRSMRLIVLRRGKLTLTNRDALISLAGFDPGYLRSASASPRRSETAVAPCKGATGGPSMLNARASRRGGEPAGSVSA